MTAAYGAAGTGAHTIVSGGACTPALPAGVVAGNLLAAHVFYGGSTTAPDTPSGWTLADGPRDLDTPATNGRVWVFTKKAVGGDAAPAFGTQAVTTPRRARVFSFTGVLDDTVANMVGGFGWGIGTTTPMADTGVTTGADSSDYLAVQLIAGSDDTLAPGAMTGETGGDWAIPGGFTAFTSTSGTPDTWMGIQTSTVVPSTTINGGTAATTAGDPWGVVGFYIRSAPPPADGELRQQIDNGVAATAAISLTLTAAEVGDTVVVIHADDFHTLAGLTTPTGTAVTTWTSRHTVDGGTDDNHAKVWTGTVTTAGGTVVEGTSNTDHERYFGAWVFVGTLEYDTASSTEVDTTATSHVAPSVTPTSGKTDDWLICLWGTGPFDSAINYTIPGSMTARTERDCSTFATFRGADERLTADSATGTRTATASAAFQWFAVSVLMKTAGGDATITATTVAAVAAIPAPTKQTGSTITAATVAAVATVPAATVRLGVAIAPAAVAATAGIPAPTIQTGSTVIAAAVAAVAGIPAPTAQAGSVVIATSVSAAAAVPVPSVTTGGGSATVPATTVAAVAGIPAPIVQAGSTVIATSVAAVASIPTPAAVTTGATVVASTVAAAAAVPTPSVTTGGSVTIQATTVAALAAVPAPALSTGQQVTAVTVPAVAAVPTVTIQLGVLIVPASTTALAAIPLPTFHTSVIVPTFTVAAVATIPTPAIVFVGPPDLNPLRFAFTEPAPMTYTEPGAFTYRDPASSLVYQEG